MEPKYPPDAYRGFRARLPDWLIGFPSSADQSRAVRVLALQPGDCVCDVACGSGFNLRRLVRAVGPKGLVIGVEDGTHLLERSKRKVERAAWENVQLLDDLDAGRFMRTPVDGIIVSYNPPIFLQRPDLLEAAWETLKPGGRLALVAGRFTAPVFRAAGPLIRLSFRILGHPDDWHYWAVPEPWKHLEELSAGNISVEMRLGFQYLLWAQKPTGESAG